MTTESSILQHQPTLLKALVSCLNQLIEQTPLTFQPSSIFNLKTPPTISIHDYIARMLKYMNCSWSIFIYSLLLLDRAQQYNPQFVIHKKNIHRLLLVSNLVAVKYLDDMYYKNSFYATVGGVQLKVLNQLELQFLELINFNCHFDRDTYQAYVERMEIFAQINESSFAKKENQLLAEQKKIQIKVARSEQRGRREECQVRSNDTSVERTNRERRYADL